MALEPQIYRIASWEKYRLSRQTINKHRKDSLLWIPLYVDSWLFGSVRFELEPDEQATFVDLLALAAKDNGFIRANETMPYPLNSLSGMFNKSVELLERTIIKCLDPKINKLEIVDLRDCQCPLQDCQEGYKKPIARIEKNREEKNREENIKDAKASRKHNWEYSWEEIETSKSEAWKCLATFEKLWFERDGQGQFGADFDRKEAIGRINNWLGLGWKVRDWLQVFFDTKDEFIVKHTFEQFRKFVEREAKKGVK